MNIRVYLFSLIAGFIITLGIWLLILFTLNPLNSDFLIIAAFFASFALAIFCLSSLIGYYARVYIGNKEVVYSHLSISLRQGVLISLIVSGILILQTLKVLNWWIAGIWILILLLVELYFRTRTV